MKRRSVQGNLWLKNSPEASYCPFPKYRAPWSESADLTWHHTSSWSSSGIHHRPSSPSTNSILPSREFLLSSYSSNLSLNLSSSERPSLLEHRIKGRGHSYSPMPFTYSFYTRSQAKIISFDYLLAIFFVPSKMNVKRSVKPIHLTHLTYSECSALHFIVVWKHVC